MSHSKPGKARTGKSRYYPEYIHDLYYDRLNKMWYIGCRGVNKGNQFSMQWKRVEDDFPVTCPKCLKGDYL